MTNSFPMSQQAFFFFKELESHYRVSYLLLQTTDITLLAFSKKLKSVFLI